MKKIIVILLALLPVFAFAQKMDRKTADERAQKHTEKMAADLNLSESQKAKVAAINKKYADVADEMRADQKTEKEARRTEAQKRVEARDQEIKAVLTPEQYAKQQEMKAAHQEKREIKKEKMKAKKRSGKNKKQ